MSTQYYVAFKGQQTGPFTKEELKANGISPNSHVWREGLDKWVLASTLPELSDILIMQPQQTQQFQQPQQTQQPEPQQQAQYAPGTDPYRSNIPHQNWMTWAVISTVLGFFCSCIGMIFGIIAIVKANNANKAYAMGDEATGDMYNSGAKTWTIVAFVVTVLGFFFSLIWLRSIYWWY